MRRALVVLAALRAATAVVGVQDARSQRQRRRQPQLDAAPSRTHTWACRRPKRGGDSAATGRGRAHVGHADDVEAREEALRDSSIRTAVARRQRRASAARARRCSTRSPMPTVTPSSRRLSARRPESLARRDRQDKPTADQLADADVMLSAAFTTYGEDMLTGQVDPKTLGTGWHINPRKKRSTARCRSRSARTTSRPALVRMRPQDPGYDSLRMQLGAYRAIVVAERRLAANSRRQAAPPRRQGFAGALAALRGRSRAEGTSRRIRRHRPPACTIARSPARSPTFRRATRSASTACSAGDASTRSTCRPTTASAQIAANLERYRWLPRSLGNATSSSTCRSSSSTRVRQRTEVARDEGHRRPGVRGQGDAGVQRLDGVSSSSVRTGT